MLFRSIDGRLKFVSRKDYKNEQDFLEKIYNIKKDFAGQYKNVYVSKSFVSKPNMLKISDKN